jgi:hypothetical protein
MGRADFWYLPSTIQEQYDIIAFATQNVTESPNSISDRHLLISMAHNTVCYLDNSVNVHEPEITNSSASTVS